MAFDISTARELTPEEEKEFIETQRPKVAPQEKSTLTGKRRLLANGLTFGAEPILEGVGGALGNTIANIKYNRPIFEDIKKTYLSARNEAKQDIDKENRLHPYRSVALEILGGLPTGAGMLKGVSLASKLKSPLSRLVASGGIGGGIIGANEGATSKENEVLPLKETTQNALKGAIGGAVVSPLLYGGYKLGKFAINNAGDIAKTPIRAVAKTVKAVDSGIKGLGEMVKSDEKNVINALLENGISKEAIEESIKTGKPLIDTMDLNSARKFRNLRAKDSGFNDVADKYISEQRQNRYSDINEIADKISKKHPFEKLEQVKEVGSKINDRYYRKFDKMGDLKDKADFSDVLKRKKTQEMLQDIYRNEDFENLSPTDFKVLEELKKRFDDIVSAGTKTSTFTPSAKAMSLKREIQPILAELKDKLNEATKGKYFKANYLKSQTFDAENMLNKPKVWENDNSALINDLSGKTNEEKRIMKSLIANDLRSQAGNKYDDSAVANILNINKRNNLATILGKDSQILNDIDNVVKRHKNYGVMTGGSQTTDKNQLSGKNILENISNKDLFGGIAETLKNALKSDKFGTKLGEAITNPKKLAEKAYLEYLQKIK